MANATMINDIVILDSTNNIFIFETRTKQSTNFLFKVIESTVLNGITHTTNFDSSEIELYSRLNLNDSYSKIYVNDSHVILKDIETNSLIGYLFEINPESIKFELKNATVNTKVVLRYKS